MSSGVSPEFDCQTVTHIARTVDREAAIEDNILKAFDGFGYFLTGAFAGSSPCGVVCRWGRMKVVRGREVEENGRDLEESGRWQCSVRTCVCQCRLRQRFQTAYRKQTLTADIK